MPNFTLIGEVPVDKTVTEQKAKKKQTVNLVCFLYSVWRDK